MEVEEFALARTDLEEGGEQQMKEVKKDTLVADRYQSYGSHHVGNCHQYHHNYLASSLQFIIISITIVKIVKPQHVVAD